MAKFSRQRGLSEKIKQKALLELCGALVLVKNLHEAAKVLADLLSEQEVEMIAKRLQIAKALLKGMKYEEIRRSFKVGSQTIARIQLWLYEAGDGYRMIVSRGKSVEVSVLQNRSFAVDIPFTSTWMKKRYPMYYWPQLLLEEIIASANKRQQQRFHNALNILHHSGRIKQKLFCEIEKTLAHIYRQRKTK